MTTPDDAAPRRPRGRPEGSTDPNARKERVYIRMNEKEKKQADRFAEGANLPLSEYGRLRILKKPVKKK